jgi:hypothetical protein
MSVTLRKIGLALAVALSIWLPSSNAGLITQSGPRYFTQEGGGGDDTYEAIDNPGVDYVDCWVDPDKISNGDCSEGNPNQISQMLGSRPVGTGIRFRVLAGTTSVTTAAGDSKMPVLDPSYSGTESHPIIVRAECPASRSSCSGSEWIIERTASAGSILGTAGGADYWHIDGPKFQGGHGGGGVENAHIVLRSTVGWQFTRFHIDGDQEDTTAEASTNGGGIYMQLVDDVLIQDGIIEQIGAPGSTEIWQGVEMYDATDVELAYLTIRTIRGLCIFMKGAPAVEFQRNRIHHNKISACSDVGMHPYDVFAGTTTGNHNYWWNNTVADSDHCIKFNVLDREHQGTHFQNNTCVNNANVSLQFEPGGVGSSYGQYISIRNNVFDDSTKHIEWFNQFYPGVPNPPIDGGGDGNELIVFDGNRYNNFTNVMESATGNDDTVGEWQARSSSDAGADATAHTYTNFAGGDYTTATGVAADRTDTGNLYGGGSVRVGAWEPVGARTSL